MPSANTAATVADVISAGSTSGAVGSRAKATISFARRGMRSSYDAPSSSRHTGSPGTARPTICVIHQRALVVLFTSNGVDAARSSSQAYLSALAEVGAGAGAGFDISSQLWWTGVNKKHSINFVCVETASLSPKPAVNFYYQPEPTLAAQAATASGRAPVSLAS
jgi:hypothetical protein